MVVARRDVIESYEGVCARGRNARRLVDIASLQPDERGAGAGEPPGGDWLLVHVARRLHDAGDRAHRRDLIFFRTPRAMREGDLADLVHQTAMYYEDRLGGAALSA